MDQRIRQTDRMQSHATEFSNAELVPNALDRNRLYGRAEDEWISAGGNFMEADLIRWNEGAFKQRRKREKAAKLGKRLVVAEVLRHDEAWVYLSVRHCKFSSVQTGFLERQVPLLLAGTEIKRKRSTMSGGRRNASPGATKGCAP